MKVIDQNAERKALDALKASWKDAPTDRCLFVQSSRLYTDEPDQESRDKFKDALLAALEDHKCQVFICDDLDAFVGARTLTHKCVGKIIEHLSRELGLASERKPAFMLCEVGVDWTKLKALITRKIVDFENRQKKRAQKRHEDVAKVSREQTIQTLDRDLISSLAMRRDMRVFPEIMVVEDDLFSQRLIDNALKNKYSVSITGDGQGAIMSYVNKAPDVLFLDIELPDINGHEVLNKIFEIDPSAYVVMFSGNGNKTNVMKAIERGAKGFIGKPFSMDKLMHYIEKSPYIQAKHRRETM